MQTRRESLPLLFSAALAPFLFSTIAVLPVGSAFAAAPAEVPTFTGEAWKKPTTPFSLKITVQSYAPNAQSPIVSSSILATKGFSHMTVQYRAGSGREFWFADGRLFSAATGTNEVSIAGGMAGSGVPNPDFPEFQWIKPALYKGTLPIGGENCLIFAQDSEADQMAAWEAQIAEIQAAAQAEAKANGQSAPAKASAGAQAPTQKGPSKQAVAKYPPGPIGGLPLKAGILVAAISERTRLPKFFQEGTDVRQYDFGTPEGEALKLPPKVQSAIDFYKPRTIAPILP